MDPATTHGTAATVRDADVADPVLLRTPTPTLLDASRNDVDHDDVFRRRDASEDEARRTALEPETPASRGLGRRPPVSKRSTAAAACVDARQPVKRKRGRLFKKLAINVASWLRPVWSKFVVALLIISLASPAVAAATTFTKSRMSCLADSKTYWIRSSCGGGGFVVVRGAKVLAEPLSRHDRHIELVKEECLSVDESSSLLGPVKIRVFSQSANKYICFNKAGRVKAVPSRRVDGRGDLCTFIELPAASAEPVITFKSAFNSSWFLGFRRSRRAEETSRSLVPVRMSGSEAVKPEIGCEFKFVTGRFSPIRLEKKWQGLYKLWPRQLAQRRRRTRPKLKASKNLKKVGPATPSSDLTPL